LALTLGWRIEINSRFHLLNNGCSGFDLVLGADSIHPKGRMKYSAFRDFNGWDTNPGQGGFQHIEMEFFGNRE
jgi:hypothetical protein